MADREMTKRKWNTRIIAFYPSFGFESVLNFYKRFSLVNLQKLLN